MNNNIMTKEQDQKLGYHLVSGLISINLPFNFFTSSTFSLGLSHSEHFLWSQSPSSSVVKVFLNPLLEGTKAAMWPGVIVS